MQINVTAVVYIWNLFSPCLSYYFPRWRFSAASIFSLAKERLEPLLNEAKPGILGKDTLRKYTFLGLQREREKKKKKDIYK